MISRIIGGILLIMGTSIGAGMLALPLANAANGFSYSVIYLLVGWVVMTLGALYLLEVNLYLKPGNHMISMAFATLGKPGLVLCWLSYLFLLYTLLCAYIAGGTDVLAGFSDWLGLKLPDWILACIFTFSLGFVVFGGIHHVDLFNRALMFIKFIVFFCLIGVISPYIKRDYFYEGQWETSASNLMIILTSFGFAIIVPNLRVYFNSHIPSLKKVIFIGSLVPLLCYLAWDFVIMGSLPADGNPGLLVLNQLPHPTTGLSELLSRVIHTSYIHQLFNIFTSVCMLTAFLGVALCLQTFLADGLQLSNRPSSQLLLFTFTFTPPLIINLFIPGLYLHALAYAGNICVILLLFLPAMMAYAGRKKFPRNWQVPGGKSLIFITIMISLFLLLFNKIA